MQILVFVVVRFVNLQNGIMLLIFLIFCTIDFKISKRFDFNINQTLCFLLINYNDNEPNI